MTTDNEKIKEYLEKIIDPEIEGMISDMDTHHIDAGSELCSFLSRGDLMILSILAHRYIDDYDYEENDKIGIYYYADDYYNGGKNILDELIDKEIERSDNE